MKQIELTYDREQNRDIDNFGEETQEDKDGVTDALINVDQSEKEYGGPELDDKAQSDQIGCYNISEIVSIIRIVICKHGDVCKVPTPCGVVKEKNAKH